MIVIDEKESLFMLQNDKGRSLMYGYRTKYS